MKKILLVMALLLPLILVSCNDNQDNSDNQEIDEPINLEQELIGKWNQVFQQNISYIFYSNHEGQYVRSEHGEVMFSRYYTWALNGNIVTVISIVNENFGPIKISNENGTLYLIDANGNKYVKMNNY